MSVLKLASASKVGTTIGTLLLAAAGVLQAVALDPWARERAPWLGVAAIVCTGVGTALAATGRPLTAPSTERRAEDPPNANTAEMRAQQP